MVLFRVFICICISTIIFVVWTLFLNRQTTNYLGEKRNSKVLFENYVNVTDLKNVKYMLLWTPRDFAPFYYFYGNSRFIENNCLFNNCYVTDDRNYFGKDLSRFHAIAFNGRNLDSVNWVKVPRSLHQKFIYFNLESSANFGVKSKRNDGVFNWTSTYKLDSDIPYPYILIRDRSGKVVGPKPVMEWRENMTDIDEELVDLLRNKTKVALTFVSNCKTKSSREKKLRELSEALIANGYELDIYGNCGNKECERSKPSCDHMINQYYFYMAFENSFSKDYVTEKLLRALQNNAVPIVYGGADYSRFLPPGSYLNAREHTVDDLVAIMINLMKNPESYRKFFGWKKYYTYHDPKEVENVCTLCEVLNNKTKVESISTYNNFRAWWNE